MELIKRFAQDDYRDALESWTWVDLDGKAPTFTSLFGDVFFQAADGFWFLDTIEGALTRPWATREEIEAVLATRDGREQFLSVSLATAAAERGLQLGERDVYDFRTPPILGGAQQPDNLGVM